MEGYRLSANWKARVVLNGRVLLQEGAGVARYVRELQHRLKLDLMLPPRRLSRGVAGHLWEQLVLPQYTRDRVLFSPANTGPLGYHRQVVTIHDVATLDHPEWFSRRFAAWYRILIKTVARSAARIIVPSSFTMARLLAHLPEVAGKVSVLYHGIDHVAWMGKECKIETSMSGGVVYLVVGTLEPRKNLGVVIQAWPKVRRVLGKKAKLLIVGGVGPKRVFRRSGIENWPEGAEVLGRVSDRELAQLYQSASAFVYPSRYEGFGFPVLEALAHGVPTVASNIPVMKEVAGSAIIRANPDSPSEFADAMVRVVENNELRQSLRQRGLELAAQYRWDACADRTVEILKEVV